MPDPEGQSKTPQEDLPQTPLHGYKEGREEDVKGDVDALKSSKPQQSDVEGEDELDLPAEKE
jgi:hypothetical protein